MLMLEFGKYKGKKINEIYDHEYDFDYIKFLSNYDYDIQFINDTLLNSDNVNDYKLNIYDCHLKYLNMIISYKDNYIDYWNHRTSNGLKTIFELVNSKNEIWIKLDNVNNDLEKIKLICQNKNYFDNKNMKWIDVLDRYKIFNNFYLVLNYPNIVQEVRSFLKNNKICLHCGNRMLFISSSKIYNTEYDDDWEIKMFHKQCYKKIIDEYK